MHKLLFYTFEKGFLTKDDLLTFEKNNSDLLGHPVVNRQKGIEFSNGSLGMGLSLGIGLALSSKRKQNTNFKSIRLAWRW